MRTVVIAVPGYSNRMITVYRGIVTPPVPLEQTREHLEQEGIEATYFAAFPGAKLGLVTTRPYTVDDSRGDEPIPPGVVGCWLSHRTVWAALAIDSSDEDLFLILEDDALFTEGWRERLNAAVLDAGDFDLLYVGSCCTLGKPSKHIAGEVYEIRYPFCMHAYIVRKRALETLISTQDEAGIYAPIDISVAIHTMPLLRTYTVIPRIVDQRGMDLPL